MNIPFISVKIPQCSIGSCAENDMLDRRAENVEFCSEHALQQACRHGRPSGYIEFEISQMMHSPKSVMNHAALKVMIKISSIKGKERDLRGETSLAME
jgi:hypothetical protein